MGSKLPAPGLSTKAPPLEAPKVSLVFPVWNEEGNLEALYQQSNDACRQAGVAYEMVFVDDGSTDRSLEIIKRLRSQDRRVRYVSLARNFGHQGALFAGLTACTGDAVVTMDADLQHPPALIPKMIALWREGSEVVYTTKQDPKLPWWRHLVVRGFYKGISMASGMELDFGLSDFRLLDRRVVDVIIRMPECHHFLRGQVKWVGFRQQGLAYDVQERYRGQSKFSFGDSFAFALDGLFAFSWYPLRIVAVVGSLAAVASFLYLVFVLGATILKALHLVDVTLTPGWAGLATAVLFLGSVQLAAIGVLGEYVGRLYDQVKGRPAFVVREASGDGE